MAPTGAFWLGNENARLDVAPLAVAHNATFFVAALSDAVVVYDRRSARARYFEGLTAPIALDDTTLVAAREKSVVVVDLASETAPRALGVGETPTLLDVNDGRLFGAHAKGTFACQVSDFRRRAGELFWGPDAPRFIAVANGRAVKFEPATRSLSVVAIDGDGAPVAPVVVAEGFRPEGAAIGQRGVVVFGRTSDGGAACVLGEGVCRAVAVAGRPVAAAFAELPLVLDDTGRLWSLKRDEPALVYDPGMVTAPRPLLSVDADDSLMVVHHQQVAHLVRDGERFVDVHNVGHRDRVTALSFSPSGKTLFSAALDGTVKAWSVSARRQLSSARIQAELGGVWDVSAVDDERVVALSSPDHLTLLSTTGAVLVETDLVVRRPGTTAAIAVAADRLFAWGPSQLRVLSVDSLSLTSTFSSVRLPRDNITGGALHPSARGVLVARAAGCADGGFLDPASGACTPVSPRVVKARQLDAWEAVAVAHQPGTWLLRGEHLLPLENLDAPADAVFVVDGGKAAVFVGRTVATKVDLTDDTAGAVQWSVPLPAYARLRAVAVSSDGTSIARAGIVRRETREQMHVSKEAISLVDVSIVRRALRSPK